MVLARAYLENEKKRVEAAEAAKKAAAHAAAVAAAEAAAEAAAAGENGGGEGGGRGVGEEGKEGKAKQGRKRNRPKSNQSEKATRKKVPGPPVHHDGDSSSMDTGSLMGSLAGNGATDETYSIDDVQVRGACTLLYSSIITFSVERQYVYTEC